MSFPHKARKRFGQNFLHDANIIRHIIDAIAPVNTDHLLEIGPGQGALTTHLIDSQARLDVVEIDRDLAAYLEKQYHHCDRFTLHQQDILKFNIAHLSEIPNSLRIIGNLPYNISTPVLFHLLNHYSLIRDMTFMLQLEVVQRMAATVGDKNYGRLGLMIQYHCQVEHLFNVPSTAFTPAPKVNSAIVRLRPHQVMPVQADDVSTLEKTIRTAFNQRRKTLRNSLKELIDVSGLEQLGINPGLRPENISLKEYVSISDAIFKNRLG